VARRVVLVLVVLAPAARRQPAEAASQVLHCVIRAVEA
jgi:hypothetical protein